MEIWSVDLLKMLATIDSQMTDTLVSIKGALRRKGSTFDTKLKKDILKVVISRIEECFNKFEVVSMLEDLVEQQRSVNEQQPTAINHTTVGDSSNIDESLDQNNIVVKQEPVDELYDNVNMESSPNFAISNVFSVKAGECASNSANENVPNNIIPTVAVKKENEKYVWKEVGRSGNKKQYKCNLCPFTNHFKSHLTRHMIKHTGRKKYMCDQCPKSYAQPHNLKLHRRCHFI